MPVALGPSSKIRNNWEKSPYILENMMVAKKNKEYNKRDANRERLRKTLYLRNKNISLVYDIDKYLAANQRGRLKSKDVLFLKKLRKSISCCGTSLLLHDRADYVEYVTGITCDHKLCAICNHNRKNLLRKKYILFFGENPTLYLDETDRQVKTASQCVVKGEPIKYGLMGLTLTVPHDSGKYKGEVFYYDALLSDFNYLRKMDFWKDNVYGGEFGVETTITANGLHIHIHSLLMTRDFYQNRNILHKLILFKWNHITINDGGKNKDWTDWRISKIMEGNKLISRQEILDNLSPAGATHISLETVYEKDLETGEKIYNTPQARTNGVLETISYHFKPNLFDMGDGHCDISMLVRAYRSLEGKRLYSRYGVLYHEKTLSMNFNDFEDDLNSAKDIEQQFGNNAMQLSGLFYKVKTKDVYIDNEGDVQFCNATEINTTSTRNAINMLYADSLIDIGGKSNAIKKIRKSN